MTTLMLADVWEQIFQVPTVLFISGGIVGVVAIVAGTVVSIASRRSREQTKREIAAYVAEGTIDPDKAVAMLKAGEDPDES